jgi:hypothetical protein
MPSQRGEFEAGRTLGGLGASPAMVFGMSKQGVNLGAADFVAQVAARNKAKEELFKSKKTRFLALQQKETNFLSKVSLYQII